MPQAAAAAAAETAVAQLLGVLRRGVRRLRSPGPNLAVLALRIVLRLRVVSGSRAAAVAQLLGV